MKKTFTTTIPSLAIVSLLSLSSCSDSADDAKYRSNPPHIATLEVVKLHGTGTNFAVGDTLVATIVQDRYGRLLNGATYTWNISVASTAENPFSHKPDKSGCIYDQDASNPTDTIIPNTRGVYTITFDGKYRISGSNYEAANYTENLGSGVNVTYASGATSYTIKVSRNITVR
ncbi:MAG: hypothetical protein ACI4V2_05280 [Alloprevotella sp.]